MGLWMSKKLIIILIYHHHELVNGDPDFFIPNNFNEFAHFLFYCNLQTYVQSVPARHSAAQYSKKFVRPHMLCDGGENCGELHY
jgi:hypothetical protein